MFELASDDAQWRGIPPTFVLHSTFAEEWFLGSMVDQKVVPLVESIKLKMSEGGFERCSKARRNRGKETVAKGCRAEIYISQGFQACRSTPYPAHDDAKAIGGSVAFVQGSCVVPQYLG